MSINFRQLAHAHALAHHRNFRLAAAQLHISQPALTRSIQTLEASLGIRLFDRLSSGVELTPVGSLFMEHGRRVLREGEDLERAMADVMGLARGSLVISTGPFPGDALVPDAVAALVRSAPDIHCRIREADWADVASHLLERQSDVAVADLSTVEADDRFETELLIDDHFQFVCRSGHPLAGRGPVNKAEFDDYPLVGNRVPARIEQFLASPGEEPDSLGATGPFRVKIDVATFAATKRIVLASDGITLAPLPQVANELLNGSMTLLQTGTITPRMHSGLIYLRGRSLSPAARQFAVELRRIKADMDRRAMGLAARFGIV
ncbi:MAG: LysR family transcriptional regulator [Pseudomonadales bacterium]|nr:LysR family transcriptional regulator [Pseudomonadales bacterium]